MQRGMRRVQQNWFVHKQPVGGPNGERGGGRPRRHRPTGRSPRPDAPAQRGGHHRAHELVGVDPIWRHLGLRLPPLAPEPGRPLRLGRRSRVRAVQFPDLSGEQTEGEEEVRGRGRNEMLSDCSARSARVCGRHARPASQPEAQAVSSKAAGAAGLTFDSMVSQIFSRGCNRGRECTHVHVVLLFTRGCQGLAGGATRCQD